MDPAIVVTGASSGIGRSLALVASRERVAMVLVGQAQGDLDDLVMELSATGVRSHALAIDLADQAAGQTIEDHLAQSGLYCDVLVNCAGFGLYGLASELDRNQQVKVLDVNARALTDLSLRFLPGMLQRHRGGILNVGSITAYAPGPYMAAYFASKAYVRSFSLALAAEASGTGVTVTCLTPGVVRTPFFKKCLVGSTRLFKIAPRANAPEVAEAGWRGFKAGKRVVVPRLADHLTIAICVLLPASVLLRLIEKLLRPRKLKTSNNELTIGVQRQSGH
jgi:short-subunit dehydrogenase